MARSSVKKVNSDAIDGTGIADEVGMNSGNSAIGNAVSKGDDNVGVRKKARAKSVDCLYNAAEMANAARKRWKLPPEVVYAAFKTAGKTEVTIAEADNIVMNFLERKVL